MHLRIQVPVACKTNVESPRKELEITTSQIQQEMLIYYLVFQSIWNVPIMWGIIFFLRLPTDIKTIQLKQFKLKIRKMLSQQVYYPLGEFLCSIWSELFYVLLDV